MSRPCAGPCWPCVNCSEGWAQWAGRPRVMGGAPSRTYTSKSWRGPCPGFRPSPFGTRTTAPPGALAMPQSDHVVVLRPVQEGVVGGVKPHQAATAADISFQRLLHSARPAGAFGRVPTVEVSDHHIIVAEVRLGGPRTDCDRESSRTFEDA